MAVERHVTDLLPAYALGCLDAEEAALVASHLETCAHCRADLAGYEAVTGNLALAAPDAAPPAALKRRLMARVAPAAASRRASERAAPAQRLAGWLRPAWPVLGLAALLLIVALGVSNLLLWQRLNEAPPPVGTLRTIGLVGTDAAPVALGTLVVSMDERHGVLAVDGLPPLDATQQYQLWLIDQEGQRTSGAVFSVDEAGYGAAIVEAPQPIFDYSTFGVTIEPAGGSPGPTGTKVLGGEL
ncbi:MAG: anti-sigma factor [Anaerolineae bacterium]|nr:anti-sigma factor [Anaerolineae bacterium]